MNGLRMRWWPDMSEHNPDIVQFQIQKTFGKYCIFATTKSGLSFSVSPLLSVKEATMKLRKLRRK